MAGKPKRPYLLRALYDWIVDSELTPYLLVTVDSAEVQVPTDYVDDGKIVLNVSPMAVKDLLIDESQVSFSGRFGGRPFPVVVPMTKVVAVYAKETGEGMMFDDQDEYGAGEGDIAADKVVTDAGIDGTADTSPKEGGGHLKVIK